MIVEFLLGLLSNVGEWFIGLLGTADPPEWIGTVGDVLADTISNAAGLGAWFPFPFLGVVGVFLLGLWLVLWSVKGVRWVWGITPFSGGS